MTRAWLGRAGALVGLAAVMVGCDGKGPTDPGPRSGITFERGASLTDTAMGRPAQALVVRVRGEDGKPRSGLIVRFEGVAHSGSNSHFAELEAYVGSVADREMVRLVTETTDAQGRAQILLQMGRVAGPARVVVTVPTLGIQDTARYTITSAAAYRVSLAPKDTVLYPGKTYTLRGGVVDRWGNMREDALTFTAFGGVAVDAKGVVSTTATGRSFVVAQVHGRADTAWIGIPPQGTLAALSRKYAADSSGVVIFNLDGSGFRKLASSRGDGDNLAPQWAPSGAELVFHDGSSLSWDFRLYKVDLAGKVEQLIRGAGAEVESWPQYSRDGAHVFFARNSYETGSSLWRVRADGTGEAKVVGRVPGSYDHYDAPSPSPDGTRLVYHTAVPTRLRIVEVSSGVVQDIGVPGRFPRWSPRGDYIAYYDDGAVSIVKPDGTGRRTLTTSNRQYASTLDWSPDGKWIAAAEGSGAGLDLIEVETGVVIPLPFTNQMGQPTWKP